MNINLDGVHKRGEFRVLMQEALSIALFTSQDYNNITKQRYPLQTSILILRTVHLFTFFIFSAISLSLLVMSSFKQDSLPVAGLLKSSPQSLPYLAVG